MAQARITRVTGALVEARPMPEASLYELVYVGEKRLLGEVIRITSDTSTVQVYEDTTGVRVGEPVEPTGSALTIELGPGLLGSTLDGIGRPLARLAEESGDFLQAESIVPTLDRGRRWELTAIVKSGDAVNEGDVLGTVEERPGIQHRILLPATFRGRIDWIRSTVVNVDEPFGALEDGTPLTLAQRWSVRRPRPFAERLRSHEPLITGQRIFDLLFPVAEGGTVVVPGGFGTGKTVIEQSLAKYAAADVVVYVGCGERGNEMAEVLSQFPRLSDHRTGRSVMDRTVLVANTSNMPVAARETSVYLGVTIAEYFRDMGYRVAVMSDSLSRWAEALREIGARLQEMPGEEGYPTYLGNRFAKLAERAGRVRALGSPDRSGAVTFIAAISPAGGDFSEPVTQAALRVAGALWALDPALAHQRQFPAVDWETSYSLYAGHTEQWFADHVGADWAEIRRDVLVLLQRDRELREIAGLIGLEALQDRDRLTLEAARVVREVVLGQGAYDPNDAYSSIEKTYLLARLSRALYRAAEGALARGVALRQIEMGAVRTSLARVRGAPGAEVATLAAAAEAAIGAIDASTA
jgi:V/A-type H+-transporting ATPase subunit A